MKKEFPDYYEIVEMRILGENVEEDEEMPTASKNEIFEAINIYRI